MLLFLTGCPDPDPVDSQIIIKNLSSKNIVYLVLISKTIDTTLTTQHYPLNAQNTEHTSLNPNEESILKASFLRSIEDAPEKSLRVFIFDKDTIAFVPWDSIVVQHNYLRRYDLTKNNIAGDTWTVIFE